MKLFGRKSAEPVAASQPMATYDEAFSEANFGVESTTCSCGATYPGTPVRCSCGESLVAYWQGRTYTTVEERLDLNSK